MFFWQNHCSQQLNLNGVWFQWPVGWLVHEWSTGYCFGVTSANMTQLPPPAASLEFAIVGTSGHQWSLDSDHWHWETADVLNIPRRCLPTPILLLEFDLYLCVGMPVLCIFPGNETLKWNIEMKYCQIQLQPFDGLIHGIHDHFWWTKYRDSRSQENISKPGLIRSYQFICWFSHLGTFQYLPSSFPLVAWPLPTNFHLSGKVLHDHVRPEPRANRIAIVSESSRLYWSMHISARSNESSRRCQIISPSMFFVKPWRVSLW